MYMNLKPKKHKLKSFNITTMTSLGFIGPPNILGPPLNLAPQNFNFLLSPPPLPSKLFWSEILGPPP